MMRPKSFLWFKVPMYHYNCTMTNAQLELIAADKPVSFIKSKKKKFSKPSASKVQEAIDKFKQRQ